MLRLLALAALPSVALAAPVESVCKSGDPMGPCDKTDLQAALDDPSIEVVLLGAGPWNGPFQIQRSLSLVGMDPDNPPELTCAQARASTLDIDAPRGTDPNTQEQVAITRLSIRPCPAGRAMAVEGSTSAALATTALLHQLTFLEDVRGRLSDNGGYLHVGQSAAAVVEATTFEPRAIDGDGGHIYVAGNGALRVLNSVFLGGDAGAGGAISGASGVDITLSHSTFKGNVSSSSGGAISALEDPFRFFVTDSRFEENRAASHGGAIFLDGSPSEQHRLQRSIFLRNSASKGGALALTSGDVAITDTAFAAHDTATQGGAIWGESTDLTLIRATLTRNSASDDGGAIWWQASNNGGDLHLRSSHLQENSAGTSSSGSGGAIHASSSTGDPFDLTVIGTTFRDNDAVDNGGAIALQTGSLDASWSTFRGNTLSRFDSLGGALNLFNFGELSLEHNLFCANDAASGGGVVARVSTHSGHRVRQNVFGGNESRGSGGGALFLDGLSAFDGSNNHFLENSGDRPSAEGAAVYLEDSDGIIANAVFQGGAGSHGMYGHSHGMLGGHHLVFHAPYSGTYTVPDNAFPSSVTVKFHPTPVGKWSDTGCTEEVWSPAGHALYTSGSDPDSADPAPLGAFTAQQVTSAGVDIDLDGAMRGDDCNDRDPTIFPGAEDEACDGIDADCDGDDGEATWYRDGDGDGLGDASNSLVSCGPPGLRPDEDFPPWWAQTPGDCDDLDDAVGGPVDTWDDRDGDGFGESVDVNGQLIAAVQQCPNQPALSTVGGDCDDTKFAVNPDAEEVCNSIDDDCNERVDDEPSDAQRYRPDVDGDGFGAPGDDILVTACPGEPNLVDPDNDGDCDDGDATIGEAIEQWPDSDGDGFGASLTADGDPLDTSAVCPNTDGWTENPGDCDDGAIDVNVEAVERCDGTDNDCNQLVDDEPTDPVQRYADGDGDGFGAGSPLMVCADTPDTAPTNDDCDDELPEVNPDAAEVCNGLDDDCDDTIDTGATDGTLYYLDLDGDGHAGDIATETACSPSDEHFAFADDCNDQNETVHPSAPETCDPVDVNCDGDLYDGASDASWYVDSDEDGFGDPATETKGCLAFIDGVLDATDCDDSNADVYPGAPEPPGTSRDCSVDTYPLLLVSGGCASAPAPSAPLGWLAALLFLRRRRQCEAAKVRTRSTIA